MSDFCLNELFKLDCNVSNYCWFSEIGEGIHSGYGTTHRLLYLLAVSKVGKFSIYLLQFFSHAAQKFILLVEMCGEEERRISLYRRKKKGSLSTDTVRGKRAF